MSKTTPDLNDPINLQVMWNRLIFIADQADNALGRTAFSPIVRENHDYVTVLMDSRGRALAQCTWSIPVFISSLPAAAQQYFLPKFPVDKLIQGPAVVEQRESTAVVGPSGTAHVDANGNLVINIQ